MDIFKDMFNGKKQESPDNGTNISGGNNGEMPPPSEGQQEVGVPQENQRPDEGQDTSGQETHMAPPPPPAPDQVTPISVGGNEAQSLSSETPQSSSADRPNGESASPEQNNFDGVVQNSHDTSESDLGDTHAVEGQMEEVRDQLNSEMISSGEVHEPSPENDQEDKMNSGSKFEDEPSEAKATNEQDAKDEVNPDMSPADVEKLHSEIQRLLNEKRGIDSRLKEVNRQLKLAAENVQKHLEAQALRDKKLREVLSDAELVAVLNTEIQLDEAFENRASDDFFDENL